MSDIEPFSANSTTLVSGLADKLNETIEVVNEIDSNTTIAISEIQSELDGLNNFSDIEITGGNISNTNITAFGTGESGNSSPLTITNNTNSATFGLDNFGTLVINNSNDSLRIGDNNIFHEGNDGSGSGLDADLLDGQQGSYYTNITARLGYTPLNSAGGTLTGGIGFGNFVSPSPNNFSRHISLFGTTYGFTVTNSSLNYVSADRHDFYAGTSLRARLTGNAEFFSNILIVRNSPTNGYVALRSGLPTHTGFYEFRHTDNTLAGFVGFALPGGAILLRSEGGSHYQFNTTPRVNSDDIVHEGNFYDFSGRYDSIITHISSSTIDLNDIGGIIEVTNANVIIPNDSTVNFPVGTKLDFYNLGTGVSSIQPATGVILRSADNNRNFRVRYSAATALKRGANDWVLVGDLI